MTDPDLATKLKLLELALDGADRAGESPSSSGVGSHADAATLFFERYQVVDRVSAGGQGDVLRVLDLPYRRQVALKRLSGRYLADEAARSRFWSEVQVASQLSHPGLLPIFDVGLDPDGKPYYSTVLLRGRKLADLFEELHQGDVPAWAGRKALEALITLCEIMAYVHSRGVIHRDLTLNNVLLGEFGEVYVIDFGAAYVAASKRCAVTSSAPFSNAAVVTDRVMEAEANPNSPLLTRNIGLPGVLVYMPPEILQGNLAATGPATDIYAVGVMLYVLLTGRLPYADSRRKPPDDARLRAQILSGPPDPVRRVQPRAPRDLAAICEKCLAREPAGRYAGMKDLAEDLRAFLEIRVVQARRSGVFDRLYKWLLRHARDVLLTAISLVVILAVALVAREYKIRNDVARQISHLQQFEIESRKGQWRPALGELDAAERAGYPDRIDLALKRIGAWTALAEHDRVREQLRWLTSQPQLGRYRSLVLLRQAEHELFDPSAWPAGLDHVRQALQAGLEAPGEAAFAEGLLAQSSPEALQHFAEALRLDPYHHGAHRHALGLELLLGRFDELDRHLALFKVLYPEDPAPTAIEATRLALAGRAAEAQQLLSRWRSAVNEQTWELLMSGLRVMGEAGKLFDLDGFLRDDPGPAPVNEGFLTNALAFFLGSSSPRDSPNPAFPRLPQLPCVKNGLEKGMRALASIALPLFGDPGTAIQTVKQACQSHPECLLPLAAGTFLDPQRPTDPDQLRRFLVTQADLFQTAADLPSIVPKAHHLARFMAALDQIELGHRLQPADPAARQACIDNLRWFTTQTNVSGTTYRACLNLALEVNELDLARELLSRWERLQPNHDEAARYRVQLELASGAYRRALDTIQELLEKRPDDPWALRKKQEVLRGIHSLSDSGPAP